MTKLTATSADRDSAKGFMMAGSRKARETESKLARVMYCEVTANEKPMTARCSALAERCFGRILTIVLAKRRLETISLMSISRCSGVSALLWTLRNAHAEF